MALLKTDVASNQQSNTVRNLNTGKNETGRVLYAFPAYTTTGAEAAGDIIDIVTLPAGSVFLPSLSRIANEACGGTGFTIATIGDGVAGTAATASAARYSATPVALPSAATAAVTEAAANAAVPYTTTAADNTIKGVLALSSGTVTASKKVQFIIAYRLP